MEVLVLDGGFSSDGESFSPQSWLRLPRATAATVTPGENGACVWIKSGHFLQPPKPPNAA
jgi:sugar/nucleoside kinase (ribokinase family)